MAYASNTDVQAEFKSISWNTSTLSATQVDTLCTRASSFIDGKISGKYTTPVSQSTSPVSYNILQEICLWLVKQRVQSILKLQTGEQKTSQGTNSDDWAKKAMDALDEIRSGKMKLPDAVLATAADGIESYTSDNAPTAAKRTFTRGNDEW